MAKSVKKEEENENVIDLEPIKEELKDYVDIKVKNSIDLELERSNRRLLREKNKKILFRDIVILILIVIIGLLIYLLYSNKYFHKFFNSDNDQKTNVVEESEVKKEEKKLTLEELINIYSYLLNNIVINEKSDYLDDYYSGNLTNELKHYLVFNSIDLKTLDKEDDYNIIESSVISGKYSSLFEGNYEPVSFKYDSNKVRYMSKMESFVTDKVLENNKSNIKRVITDIKEDGINVTITCIEGLIKDDKLYNIKTDKLVSSKSTDLLKNEKDLTKVTYSFSNNKLISIK